MVLGTKDIPLCRDKKDVLSSPSDDEKEEEVCPQEAPQTIHQGVMRPTRRVTPPHITGAAIVKAVMAADLHQEALSSDTVTKVSVLHLCTSPFSRETGVCFTTCVMLRFLTSG